MKTTIVQLLTVGLLLGSGVAGFPQDRLMPDGAPVPQQAKTGYEDSVAAASETGGAEEAYDDGDDSDMYMEPDGAESTQTDSRHETTQTESTAQDEPETHREEHHQQPSAVPRVTIVAVHPVSTSIQVTSSESTESSVKSEDKAEPEEKSLETDSQNFFPSFAELFGNHRLPFTEHQQQQQQQRYRPSRFLGYFQRDRPYAVAASSNKDGQPALLGSGNFGVIRGGTYYAEDKENDEYSIDETAYSPFYHGSGRGRSNYYKNPKPQPVRGGDFFANFRDFADITAPPKSSFSHLSVVYANKNGSSAGPRGPEQPRNIIETLRMLEEEEEASTGVVTTTTTELPQKKISQGKRKLIKIKKYQEEKARKSRMTVEPLLALS